MENINQKADWLRFALRAGSLAVEGMVVESFTLNEQLSRPLILALEVASDPAAVEAAMALKE